MHWWGILCAFGWVHLCLSISPLTDACPQTSPWLYFVRDVHSILSKTYTLFCQHLPGLIWWFWSAQYPHSSTTSSRQLSATHTTHATNATHSKNKTNKQPRRRSRENVNVNMIAAWIPFEKLPMPQCSSGNRQTNNCKKQTTQEMQQRTDVTIFTWHSIPTS